MLGRLNQEKAALLGENAAKAGLGCSVLNRESAGVPEDAVADRSLRFPAFCNALRKTFSVWTKLLVCRYACTGVHTLYNNQAPRGRPPLFYDHPCFTTTPI